MGEDQNEKLGKKPHRNLTVSRVVGLVILDDLNHKTDYGLIGGINTFSCLNIIFKAFVIINILH